ncbi:zinc ribbon domain-containing protein, partial [Planktothricoides raciborskii]
RGKIQNLIKDLHNKSASFLVKNYKLIFLPTFETSNMVSRQKRKIRSRTARNLLTWSHYKFAENLKQMAARNGVIVVRCNESFTSKTCPKCGQIHEKLGANKKFQCPKCGYIAPRDWNGARNIMLRALQATAFTIVGDVILFSEMFSDEQV